MIQRSKQQEPATSALWNIVWFIPFLLHISIQRGLITNHYVIIFTNVSPFLIASYYILTQRSKVKPYIQYFKHPINPLTYYSIKLLGIVVAVFIIVALTTLSYLTLSQYFLWLEFKWLVITMVVCFSASVLMATLFGEHLLGCIFNKMDQN